MKNFVEMDPEVVLKLIEGYEDELTPALETREENYRRFRCPRCRCQLQKEFDPRIAFSEEEVLPKFLLACPNCTYLIDPHTNVIVRFGDASKIPVESSPLILFDQKE
jgi:hypothetical protein